VARDDVERYFNEYVFGFMENDVQRELTFATSPLGAGNVLAALGVVTYTEVLGRIWNRNLSARKTKGAPNFNACFDAMGIAYPKLRSDFEKREKATLYDALRNGLAHEYAPKVPFDVVMFGDTPVAIRRRRSRYVFVVEAYLRDFRTANRRIYRELMALDNPQVPPPD